VLAAGVMALVLTFQRSSSLADIYGVAVTGTFVLDTILFLAVARGMWRIAAWKLCLLGGVFLTVEVSFFASNVSKVAHGAWIPLCVGLTTAVVMVTWKHGRQIVSQRRDEEEGPLDGFLYRVRMMDPPIFRAHSLAVYLSPGRNTTPLALKADVERHGIFHEKVLMVSVEYATVPRVSDSERFIVETLGSGLFKIRHVTIVSGYRDDTDVPNLLQLARKRGLLERNLDLEHASYFLSRITISATRREGMSRWRKLLFVTMARNAASPIDTFHLPVERTAAVGSMIEI
jgi:KUP system potassium uptake protein